MDKDVTIAKHYGLTFLAKVLLLRPSQKRELRDDLAVAAHNAYDSEDRDALHKLWEIVDQEIRERREDPSHTPGPWGEPYLDTLPNGLKAFRIDSLQEEGVSVIAMCYTGDTEITELQRANVRLIAKAPKMYEHAKLLVARLEEYDRRINGIPSPLQEAVEPLYNLLSELDNKTS